MKNKNSFLEYLSTTPIVQVACQKSNISRATYYRWCKEDEQFKKEALIALKNGHLFINDLAESQLISGIKSGQLGAIIFWLKHHHSDYFESNIFLSVASQKALIKHIRSGDKGKIYKKIESEVVKGQISPTAGKNIVSMVKNTPPTTISIVQEATAQQEAIMKFGEK